MEILLTALAIFVLTRARLTSEQNYQKAIEGTNLEKKEQLELDEDLLELEIAYNEAQIEHARLTNTVTDDTRKLVRELKEQKVALEDIGKELDKAAKKAKSAETAAKGLASELQGMLGISDDLGDSLVGSFVQAAKDGHSLREIMSQVDSAMSKAFTATNVLVSGFAKLQEMTIGVAIAQDQAISGFIKATGTGGAYTTAITDAYLNTRTLGVEMNEAAEAAMSLYTEFAVFTSLGNNMKQMLIENVATMQEFGIATSDSAAALNTMVMAFGIGVREADSIQMELINTAEAMGMPPARMMSELARVGPELAAWGRDATEVFEGLMEVSRRTGMEMSSLLGVANQFDTFYGAAEAVGRLNSMLGGPYLNAMELVNMEQDEIIHTLHGVMDASGLSFEAMGRHQRQAFATAAGFSSVADAAAVFGENFERNLVLAEQEAAAERDRAARAEQAKSVYEMMAIALQSFAISMGPIVGIIKQITLGFAKVIDFFTKTPFISDIAMGAVFIFGFISAIKILWFTMTSLFAPINALRTSLVATAASVSQNGVAATVAAKANQVLGQTATTTTAQLNAETQAVNTQTTALSRLNQKQAQVIAQKAGMSAASGGVVAPVQGAATATLGFGGALSKVLSVGMRFLGWISLLFAAWQGIKFLFGLGADDANTVGGSARLAAEGMREYDQAARDATRSSQRMVGTFSGLQDGFRVTATQVNETRKMTVATTAIVADGTDILRNSKAALELVRTEDKSIVRTLEGLQRIMLRGNEIQEKGNQGDIILKVNDRELARHTKDVMNKKLRLQREQVSG